MGKSSPKITTYSYKMSIMFGICHGIVAKIHKVFIKEKEAIHAPCHGEVFIINQPNLFGGVKKEGGAIGSVYFQPGSYTQKLHADIAAKIGGTPDTLPGNRGIVTATFIEGGPSYGSVGPGFYWSEGVPNIPPPWFMVERIGRPTVMRGYEKILRTAATTSVDEPTYTQGADNAPKLGSSRKVFVDWGRMVAYMCEDQEGNDDTFVLAYDMQTQSFIEEHDLTIGSETSMVVSGIDQKTGYLVGWTNVFTTPQWQVYDPASKTFVVDTPWPGNPSTQMFNTTGSPWVVLNSPNGQHARVLTYDLPGGDPVRLYNFPSGTYAQEFLPPSGDYSGGSHAVLGADNEALLTMVSPSGVRVMRYVLDDFGAVTEYLVGMVQPSDIPVAEFFPRAVIQSIAYDPVTRSIHFEQQVTLDPDNPTWTADYFALGYSIDAAQLIYRTNLLSTGITFWWDLPRQANRLFGHKLLWRSNAGLPFYLLDITTGELTEVSPTGHGHLGLGYQGAWWDDTTGCLYVFDGEQTASGFYALDKYCLPCDDAVYDMNPAHIIAECLTDPVWGLGLPDTALNGDNFRAVAQTLYNEDFGLSMIWNEKETIEKFVQEVIDHIEATLYINPTNGLFEIKLIRDDYDVNTLRTISPSNARLTRFSRRQPTEATNEIVLQWTNPDTEKLESITQQDLGAVVAAGRVNSDNRNYYAVHKRDLAVKMLSRDIRSAAAPLALGDAEVDRTFWDTIPGEAVKLVWPEYGITEDDPVIVRVMGVNYGKPGASKIKLKFSEDVFSLTGPALETPPESAHDAAPAVPTAADDTRFLTLPYFMAYNLVDPATAAVAEYPEVFVGALVAESDERAFEADLHGEVTGAAGNSSFEYLATLTLVAQGTLQADIPWGAQTDVSDWGVLTKGTGPVVGGLILIAADGDTDETAELCLIAGKAGDVWTLHRGVLDTVPRAWSAGTKVWFLAPDEDIADDSIRSAADTLDYKVLPRTDGGTFTEADATLLQITTSERPWLPLRPANVAINGVQFDNVYFTTKPATVGITWADRNRETENAQVLAWTDAGITPETGQTVEVDVLDETGATLLHTFTGLTGGSANLDETFFNQVEKSTVRVYAERDGLRSLQYYEALVDTRGGIGWGEDYGNDYGGAAV